jgi:ATP-dependent 26S proteasome regulatory subunit
VGQLKNYTVVLLTGPSLGLLPQACRVARALSPSAVIIEDVDLIARERGENEYASLLHNLLDEMDGLSPKIEMVFVMTTNRPEMLEPALASRPGRVDQAVEFPLPDRKARRRLFELFSRGMPLASKLDGFIERTEGASGAFIEELLRRALVFSSEEGAPKVLDAHLAKAMQELVMAGGELTQNLLGFAKPATRKKRR